MCHGILFYIERPSDTAAHTFRAVVRWLEKGRISMQKVYALLLAMLMLASVSCAWAEGTTEEIGEITFQDIPWGSSKEDVEDWAKENGFQTVTNEGTFAPKFLDASGKYVNTRMFTYAPATGDDRILFARDNTSFQIAGYLIDSLDFHFDAQNEKPELCTVVVYFQPSYNLLDFGVYAQAQKQAQAILDDLEQMLTTVYGENAVPSTDNSSSGLTLMVNSERYRKLGAEDTAICLDIMDNRAILVYGKTDVYVAEETNVSPLTIDSFDLSGL